MADAKTEKQKVQEITEKLEQGIKELFESEKYKTYLNTMSKFHNYSFNNTMLIAMQKPDATLVAGFKVFFLRLRCFEIFIFCAEWIVFLVCEVVKGYFSFVFPVPRPYRRIHGVADNNSTKGMECVNDMLLVFFCTSHGNFPLSSTNAWIEI